MSFHIKNSAIKNVVSSARLRPRDYFVYHENVYMCKILLYQQMLRVLWVAFFSNSLGN